MDEFAHISHTAHLPPEEREQLRRSLTVLTVTAKEIGVRYQDLLDAAPPPPSNDTPDDERARYFIVHLILDNTWRPSVDEEPTDLVRVTASWRGDFGAWRDEVEATIRDYDLYQVALPPWTLGGPQLIKAIEVASRKLNRVLLDSSAKADGMIGRSQSATRTDLRCLSEDDQKALDSLHSTRPKKSWESIASDIGTNAKTLRKARRGEPVNVDIATAIEDYLRRSASDLSAR